IKSINYLENILEREEAIKNGYDEVIFLNESGYLSEGSMSNIFIIKNNKIFTPDINQGLLPGIIRNFIVERYNVIEKRITLEELFNADEIFITNSILGIMKISKIENKILVENKLTNIIKEEYNQMIES
ncbi:aminotransferase class IV family protein, partial [Clostridium sp. Sa3CUN1]